MEYRIVRPDGTIKYVQAVGHPVFSPSGDLVEFVGTSIDVTERKKAEDALRRSEAYLAEAQRLSQHRQLRLECLQRNDILVRRNFQNIWV